MLSRLKNMFENLSERESQMLAAMGGAFVVLIVFLAVFFVQSSMMSLEKEAEDVATTLELLEKRETSFLQAKDY